MALGGWNCEKVEEPVTEGPSPRDVTRNCVEHQMQEDCREEYSGWGQPSWTDLAQAKQREGGDDKPESRNVHPVGMMMESAIIDEVKPDQIKVGQDSPK